MKDPTDAPASAASGQPAATESMWRRAWNRVARTWHQKPARQAAAELTEDQLSRSRQVRLSAGIIMVALAAGAAVVSYNDGLYLVRLAGIAGRVAYLYPLLPDGLIIISWASVYEAGLAQLARRPAWATGGIWLGASLTLAMNIGAGVLHNRLQALVDGVVPVVLFVALEILVGLIRRGHGAAAGPAGGDDWECPHGVAATLDEAVRLAWAHDTECLGGKPTFTEMEARFGVPRKRVAELVRGPVPQAQLNGVSA